MFDLDKWQEIFAAIRKHKLRTGLTAFGVFWGIFMLVVLLGAGKGLENGVLGMFGKMAKNSMWIWGGRTSLPYSGIKPGRSIKFTNEDYNSLKKEFPEILLTSAIMDMRGSSIINYKTKKGNFPVTGDCPDRIKIYPLLIPFGRFLNQSDLNENKKVAVIGARVQEVLFGDENPVGKYINIKGVYFLVIGVFDMENAGEGDDLSGIMIPLTTLQNTFNSYNKIETIMIAPREGVDPKELETKVKSYLMAKHQISPDDKRGVGSFNSGEEAKKFQGLFIGINIFIWVVGIMTIIAGVVGISNIMLIVVKERTKEIGLRKALGATPASIISLILTESVFITSIAGYIGLSAGVGIMTLVSNAMKDSGENNPFFSNPQIDFNTAIVATVILILSGALAGLIPAIKAAHINPIEALRAE